MEERSLKHVVISRPSDSATLAAESFGREKRSKQDEYMDSYKEVMAKLATNGVIGAYAELRESTPTIWGTWYSYCDHNLISYSVLADESYSERNAYDFLKKLSRECYAVNPELQDNHSTIQRVEIASIVETLDDDYNRSGGGDKVSQAQNQVEQERSQMQRNIEGMVDQLGQVEEVDTKARDIADGGKDFQRSASGLKNEMIARNRRLNIILIVIIVAVLLYILVPVITLIAHLAKS